MSRPNAFERRRPGRVLALALALASAGSAVTWTAGGQPAGATAPGAETSAGDAPAVDYRPPVDAPITDRFRPPIGPYGPGNRGVDYATPPGGAVRTAAAGQVVFAGRVGLGQHVVVLHADGLRTSYSFLASIGVVRGQRLEAGAVVGLSGSSLHFGVRAGETYLDPLALFSDSTVEVWLVPDDLRRPLAEGQERAGLVRSLVGLAGRAASATADGVAWAAGKGAGLAREAVALAVTHSPVLGDVVTNLSGAVSDWWDQRRDCTPSSAPTPRLSSRRLAILVGGLGSSSGSSSVLETDTAAIGYRPGDVVQFSYRGGTVRQQPYSPADTQVDLRDSGHRLRQLIEDTAAAHPGVPIDVIAHSQGGVVARIALDRVAPTGLANVVTLASPLQGADLATAGRRVDGTVFGRAGLTAAGHLNRDRIDPQSTSVRQLATTSPLMRSLRQTPLPEGVRWASIGARLDVIVPATRTRLPGADNAIAAIPFGSDHSNLPGSAAATRQVALAVTGAPLACRGIGDRVLDTLSGTGIQLAEEGAGSALSLFTGTRIPIRH